jgi:hypothetical protein
MDEARVGQKDRRGFRWWVRGERPRALCDRRFEWAYLFGAVRPATGADFALVLPEVSTGATQTTLDHFAATLAEDAHAVLVLEGAGWHGSQSLFVPHNTTLAPLPPYAPEPAEPCSAAGGADLAVSPRVLSLAPRARGLRRHRHRLLRSVERVDARARPLPRRVPLAHEGQFIGAAV